MATRCALVALRSLDASSRPAPALHIGRIHVVRVRRADARTSAWARSSTRRASSRACATGTPPSARTAMRQVKALFEFEPITESDRAARTSSGVLVKDVRGPREAFGRFVGRKDELRKHRRGPRGGDQAHRARLTIRGDHGVGKTRLLYEVERRLRKGGYNVGFHIADVPAARQRVPAVGHRRHAAGALRHERGRRADDAHPRRAAAPSRARPPGRRGQRRAHRPRRERPVARGRRERAASGRRSSRMVQSLCEDRPHAFAWDVAHAMDEDSFALLEEVLQAPAGTRALVFAFAARAGLLAPAREGRRATSRIDLGDLAAGRRRAPRRAPARRRHGARRAPALRARARRAATRCSSRRSSRASSTWARSRSPTGASSSMKLVGQDLALPKTLRGLVASRVARLAPRRPRDAPGRGGPRRSDRRQRARRACSARRCRRSSGRSPTLKERDFVVDRGPSELRLHLARSSPRLSPTRSPRRPRARCTRRRARRSRRRSAPRAWEHAARIAGHLYEAGDRERAATYFAQERRAAPRDAPARGGGARLRPRHRAGRPRASAPPEELADWLEHLATAVRLVRSAPDASELCRRVIERVDQAGTAGGARPRPRRGGPAPRRGPADGGVAPAPRRGRDASPATIGSSSSPCSSPRWSSRPRQGRLQARAASGSTSSTASCDA